MVKTVASRRLSRAKTKPPGLAFPFPRVENDAIGMWRLEVSDLVKLLLGVYVDADAWRREKLTGQETMHFAAFLAMLLQWLAAAVLLAAAGAICLLDRREIPPRSG